MDILRLQNETLAAKAMFFCLKVFRGAPVETIVTMLCEDIKRTLATTPNFELNLIKIVEKTCQLPQNRTEWKQNITDAIDRNTEVEKSLN